MDTKRKIGIIYNFNNSWVAGVYYLNSIISVLKKNSHLFDVSIVSNKKTKSVDNLPFVKFRYGLIDRIINFLGRRCSKFAGIYLNIFGKSNIRRLMQFDYIFPAIPDNFYFNRLPDEKKIFWIPDFQENYYPAFFGKQEIISRIIIQVMTAYSKGKLILSSQSAFNDFLRLYPKFYCNTVIVPFVSSICFEREDSISYENIADKYDITGKYFICSNQFWVHKNHAVVIEAISLLKQENINVRVYFTGKEYDYRAPEYTSDLKNKVDELSLGQNVYFLGFIPRNEQIALMKYAQAIIQPSLFEGWNTTIEDAKYLGKQIIASNIAVHKEQLGDKGFFFDPMDAARLAVRIKNVFDNEAKTINYEYQGKYFEFQKRIVEVFQ